MQRLSVRIYLVLLFGCLSTLIFYSSIVERTKNETSQYPTFADYTRFIEIYPDTVNCPCTRTSIPHNELVTELRVTSYHQACSIGAVYSSLLIGSFSQSDESFIDGTDFEQWKELFLRGLMKLCRIAEETAQDSVLMFQLSNMYAYHIIPPEVFSKGMD